MKFFRVLALIFVLLSQSTDVFAQMNDISGNWLITAVVVSMTHPTPQVREGFTKQEQWMINQQGNMASITTPSGTINGGFYPSTPEFPMGAWRFALQVPNLMNQPNLGARFEIVIPGGNGPMQGGSSVTYYSIGFDGSWVPAGMESWRFEGVRTN